MIPITEKEKIMERIKAIGEKSFTSYVLRLINQDMSKDN